MMNSTIDRSHITYARLAGFMFLFVIAADMLSLKLIQSFEVKGDFPATAHNIVGSLLLYRIGLSSGLIGILGTVLLAMGLYVVVKPVDKNLALLALVFRLVEVSICGVQAVLDFVALHVYIGADSMSAFGTNQLSALVSLHAVVDSAGFNISALFFGMGSILFFVLFLKAKIIPKFLSALGLFASVLVPIMCIATLIVPQHANTLEYGWFPMILAEVLVGLWLLIKGVKVQ